MNIFAKLFRRKSNAVYDTYEYCIFCNANLTLQKGYSNDLPHWVCKGCGEMLINPELEDEIVWICDECGANLNVQDGFKEHGDLWKCQVCGHENPINDREMYLSEDEFQEELKNPLHGMSDETVLGIMKYEELEPLDNRGKVTKVRNIEDGKIYVKKTLNIYDEEVIKYLKDNPIAYMPRIIEVFPGERYLVMIEEYIEGNTLESILQSGTVSEKCAISIIKDVCASLSELHRFDKPIIHRDVKPGNIIISEDGRAHLLDIDAAKWYTPQKTRDTVMRGTWDYAAPEQYGFGPGASSEKTDVYPLGIILNQMLTGKLPNEKPATGNIWPIIEKCISLDIENRYSVAELFEALTKYGEENGI